MNSLYFLKKIPVDEINNIRVYIEIFGKNNALKNTGQRFTC
jgi:hypothetical protein